MEGTGKTVDAETHLTESYSNKCLAETIVEVANIEVCYDEKRMCKAWAKKSLW